MSGQKKLNQGMFTLVPDYQNAVMSGSEFLRLKHGAIFFESPPFSIKLDYNSVRLIRQNVTEEYCS